jgi:uncharacterized membrane protein (Fun14 family)
MLMVPLDLVGDIFNLIGGSIGGLPTLVVMAVPFIVGIIVGFLVKKMLKWAILAFVVLIVLAYFGVWGLSFGTLKDWGVVAFQSAIIVVGVLPLGLGFIVGLVLGFIFG